MCLWDMKKEKVILGSRYLQIASDSALSLPVTFLDIVTASTFYDILCNPLQCSCLENPRDGGAWWAVVCGVAQSRTQLK